MNTSYALLFGGLGGAVAGALFVWLKLRPAHRRAEVQLRAFRSEADQLRRRLAELTTGTAQIFDAAARRIDKTSREAERSSHARRALDARWWSALEPMATSGETDFDELSRVVRLGETAVANVGSGLRELDQELTGLERATGLVAELATALEHERSDRGMIEALGEAAAETIAAAAAMDDAIQRVQDRAAATATLSAKTSSEAERGYRAVHRTLDEIERIRDVTVLARTQINALGERVDGIGGVVRVIQEITEKTNLLALNASIIAAQAGQHGRSFSVVAREIKALAQRTSSSTKEISEQIRGVQEESERATAAMNNGAQAVQEGFRVAVAAGDALTAIRESALTAQRRVQSMTRAYKQQSSATRQVVDLAGKVSERAAALTSTARGQNPERLAATAAELQATVLRIKELIGNQRDAAVHATESHGNIVAEVAKLTRAERHLHKQLVDLQRDAGSSRAEGDALVGRLAQVREATDQLRNEIKRLQADVG